MDLGSLEIRMVRCENLPTLPQAATTVLRLADDPNANSREIERAIETDAAIAAKLLKVANSAFYGGVSVPNLGRAISFLGMTTVRSVVVSIAMQQMAAGRSQCANFDRNGFWGHSLAVAIGSRILGKINSPGRAEEMFCAGMMHEIGLLAMEKFAPQELSVAIALARANHVSLLDAELSTCGFTHAQAGVVLAQKWGLSALMADAIAHVDAPFNSVEHSESTLAVAVADNLAWHLGFGHSVDHGPREIEDALLTLAGVSAEQIGVVGAVVSQEVGKAQESFQMAA